MHYINLVARALVLLDAAWIPASVNLLIMHREAILFTDIRINVQVNVCLFVYTVCDNFAHHLRATSKFPQNVYCLLLFPLWYIPLTLLPAIPNLHHKGYIYETGDEFSIFAVC